MITIDGSVGEGGGQILRSALGLSLVSGRPFHIKNIRAGRKKPGIMRQHLTGVRAAMEIGGEVEGAAIGSQELFFTPGRIKPGKYHFSIGTAGSCTLVFQAILPALLVADGASKVVLEGGTHNPFAPPFDFLQNTFLPLLDKMGCRIEANLERPGFFPAGGGRVVFSVHPAATLEPLELTELAEVSFSAKAVCAQLPHHIATRELAVVKKKLGISEENAEVVCFDTHGPGNVLTISAQSKDITETFTGFGQKKLSAEKVAQGCAKKALSYLKNKAPVGPYLADQLLIPMALAGGGVFITGKPTKHTLTNVDVIKKFLDVTFQITETGDNQWKILIA